jgi:hypothetical protein
MKKILNNILCCTWVHFEIIDFTHFPILDNILNQPSSCPEMRVIVKEISYPVCGLLLVSSFSW